MDAYKRIFKRGALAVGVTIVIGSYGLKASEWTRGLSSYFIVFAQAVTDNRSTNHIFAQVADGVEIGRAHV